MDEVEKLIEQLQDGTLANIFAATKALGEIGGPESVEPLAAALRHEDYWVRTGAADALVRIGGKRAVDALSRALAEELPPVRAVAANALGKIGDARAVEPLIIALKDADNDVRITVAEALGKTGDVRAIAPLLQMIASAPPLLRTLYDKDDELREAAAMALGNLGRREALPGLRAHLRSYAVAGGGLVRSNIRTAIASIEKATAGTAGLPRAAQPETLDSARRPRAGDEAEAP